jgi:exosortase
MSTPKHTVPAITNRNAAVTLLRSPAVLKWAILLLPLAYFWFRLINNLQVDWRTNPQYSYGLLVPFLCLGLLIRRWHAFTEVGGQRSEVGGQWSVVLLFACLAFLYLPTRLIEAAVPEWNPIQWLLGIEAVGLTLCVIWLGKGPGWARQLAFPICFFLVAIPWPSLVEQPIIQNLTRASAAIVVELLGWVGVPAVTHGNVIEVGTGMVGIDEACSGIRSFQSSLMISLFFGEFYRLSRSRRWLLVPLGFLFSMAFNICRMSLLTLIAAKKGVAAISEYHDPAGITIAILCTLALWGLAFFFTKQKAESRHEKAETENKPETPKAPSETSKDTSRAKESRNLFQLSMSRQSEATAEAFPISDFKNVRVLAISLLIWLVLVEAGVQIWYHSRESHLKRGPAWTLAFPRDNPTLKDLPIDDTTRNLLRFDKGQQAEWTEPDGTQWQGFYFSWVPGRVAGYLAKRHTPEICLTASGLTLLSGPKLTMMDIHGVELPIRSYVFQTGEGVVQVFHCRWEAGAGKDTYVDHESARYNLIRAIWAGRGDQGQRVLEFVISGIDDPEQAKQALARELEKLIKVEQPEILRDR